MRRLTYRADWNGLAFSVRPPQQSGHDMNLGATLFAAAGSFSSTFNAPLVLGQDVGIGPTVDLKSAD